MGCRTEKGRKRKRGGGGGSPKERENERKEFSRERKNYINVIYSLHHTADWGRGYEHFSFLFFSLQKNQSRRILQKTKKKVTLKGGYYKEKKINRGASYMKQKAYNTRYSQAVSHPSTNRALCCLTSVIGREPVYSAWYGRRLLFFQS